jgi:hypothetical protein
MPEHPIEPEIVVDDIGADVATESEDDNPLSHTGEAADPPEDMGRPEGVAP